MAEIPLKRRKSSIQPTNQLSSNTITFEHVTMAVTLSKDFSIWHMCSLLPDLFDGTIGFKYLTFTVTFDLLLKNFEIDQNFHTIRDGAFKFVKMWTLTYFCKTLTFNTRGVSLSSDTCYLVCFKHVIQFALSRFFINVFYCQSVISTESILYNHAHSSIKCTWKSRTHSTMSIRIYVV